MNKADFAKEIIKSVRFSNDNEEAFEHVCNLLTQVKPRNRFKFAEWRKEENKSTPEKCWD